MKNIRLIIIVTFLFALVCSANAFKTTATDSSLKDLHFLAGIWKVENKETYEEWKTLEDGSLSGTSYKIREGKKVVSEELSIKIVADNITYQAKVLNQNNGETIAFKLNTEVSKKFSFENLSHDFPKKIQYTKLSDTTLLVEVLGADDKGFSFKMNKEK